VDTKKKHSLFKDDSEQQKEATHLVRQNEIQAQCGPHPRKSLV
jgi:hypothetical protein